MGNRAQIRNKNETQKVSNPLRTTRPMEHLQIDLFDMISYANVNKWNRYVLMVIDCFSKYAWAVAITEKTGANVANSLQNIFFSEGPPHILQSDNGSEFKNPVDEGIVRTIQYRATLWQGIQKVLLYSFLEFPDSCFQGHKVKGRSNALTRTIKLITSMSYYSSNFPMHRALP